MKGNRKGKGREGTRFLHLSWRGVDIPWKGRERWSGKGDNRGYCRSGGRGGGTGQGTEVVSRKSNISLIFAWTHAYMLTCMPFLCKTRLYA